MKGGIEGGHAWRGMDIQGFLDAFGFCLGMGN
jgi:hypothetical protein